MNNNIIKVIRYCKIVGIRRTLLKICGRKRIPLPLFCFFFRKKPRIGIIGCGQFAFSTIGYFIYVKTWEAFLLCYDTNPEAASTFASFYKGCKTVSSPDDILKNPSIDIVYIASDHFSHTPYAIAALNNNKIVHLEKPISVSQEQWKELKEAIKHHPNHLYIGYNRPFSQAVKMIDQRILNKRLPLSITCFIAGHKIPANHWYRDPKEGGRICGNLGHWLDLTIHLMNARGYLPNKLNTHICWTKSDVSNDDIFSVSMSSDFGDLITIMLTSQSEPLEGIHENIQIQCGETLAAIDDFRKVEIWDGAFHQAKRFYPKDVGHQNCILQAIHANKACREQKEYIISTSLMLFLRQQEESHCIDSQFIVTP